VADFFHVCSLWCKFGWTTQHARTIPFAPQSEITPRKKSFLCYLE
jgi:hypothetical protein